MVQSIHSYIEHNDDSQVKHWLQTCTDVDEVDSKGRTPLYVAVESNLPKIAKLLIKKGCNPNCTDSTPRTALQLAIESQNFKLCEMLLANRADPNKEKNQFCLLTAVELQNMKLIELLINCRADVNKEKSTGISAISTTCDQKESINQTKMMQLLLKGGAKINALNSQGYTPLHQACINGSSSLVQLLIKSNGKCDQLTSYSISFYHFVSFGHFHQNFSFLVPFNSTIQAFTQQSNDVILRHLFVMLPNLAKFCAINNHIIIIMYF